MAAKVLSKITKFFWGQIQDFWTVDSNLLRVVGGEDLTIFPDFPMKME